MRSRWQKWDVQASQGQARPSTALDTGVKEGGNGGRHLGFHRILWVGGEMQRLERTHFGEKSRSCIWNMFNLRCLLAVQAGMVSRWLGVYVVCMYAEFQEEIRTRVLCGQVIRILGVFKATE